MGDFSPVSYRFHFSRALYAGGVVFRLFVLFVWYFRVAFSAEWYAYVYVMGESCSSIPFLFFPIPLPLLINSTSPRLKPTNSTTLSFFLQITIITIRNPQTRRLLLSKLSHFEDISPTGGAILSVLAQMYSPPPPLPPQILGQELAELVPRGLAYLAHGMTSVRRGAAACLLRVLRATPAPLGWLTERHLRDIIRMTW